MTNEDKIRRLAYRLYEKRGRAQGKELDDWLRAERIISGKTAFFNFIKHPLVVLIVSGVVIFLLQQMYLKNEKRLGKKYEIFKLISPTYVAYYQETWNQWYAFENKTPSEEYRKNIQRVVIEAKTIETQLPIVFKDKKIYEDWHEILSIFWEANYPISREGISEQKLNEKLNKAQPLLNNVLNRMYGEIK